MMQTRIKGWQKFQHFKDRLPPWIKLYRDLLDDPDFHALSGDDAKILIMLWLLASEDETKSGLLPSEKKIAFRLRISEKQLIQHLTNLSHWLLQDDINVISERYQLDAPETETETYKPETETENAREENTKPPTPPTLPGLACKAMRKTGIASVNPSHPKLVALCEAGTTLEEFRLAAEDAKEMGKATFPYVLGIVEGRRRDAAAMPKLPGARKINGGTWYKTEAGIVSKGKECGIMSRPGETMEEFKQRVIHAVENNSAVAGA